MIDNTEPIRTTAAQDGWVDFAADLRAKLHHKMGEIPMMDPAAIKTFVAVCNSAYWLEVMAHVFDDKVEINTRPFN